jgi:hypothetical protein
MNVAHVLLPVLRFEPDVAALRSGPVPVAVGVGAESGDGVPALSARALAGRLGVEPLVFPATIGAWRSTSPNPPISSTRLSPDTPSPAERTLT